MRSLSRQCLPAFPRKAVVDAQVKCRLGQSSLFWREVGHKQPEKPALCWQLALATPRSPALTRAKKRGRSVEEAVLEKGDVELAQRIKASSLGGSARLPFFAKSWTQWDKNLQQTHDSLRRTDGAAARASAYEQPLVPLPRPATHAACSSTGSSRRSSSTSSDGHSASSSDSGT